MEVSYKEGYLEAVLFIFLQDQKILIEYRPAANQQREVFIPNGKIEQRDLLPDGDYRITALKREVAEEFSNQVTVIHHIYLGNFIVDVLKINFYGYLINEWQGTMPSYTIEEGEKFADLQWIPIEDYQTYLTFESSRFFVKKVLQLISEQAF